MTPSRHSLQQAYDRLFAAFGRQHWWPGETRFEIIVGAVLTQNTNWSNVERAIHRLKQAGVLTPPAMHRLPAGKLAKLIQPSGTFNIKARRLKNFLDYLFRDYNGSLRRMAAVALPDLRRQLLAINGIGPETADAILLYAFGKPVFVIDAYTRRILRRHGVTGPESGYHDLQNVFHQALPLDRGMFKEYHALIVRVGKEFCRPTPRCDTCPLREWGTLLISES